MLGDLRFQSLKPFWSETARGFPINSTPRIGKALDFESLGCTETREGQNPLDFEPTIVPFKQYTQLFIEQAIIAVLNPRPFWGLIEWNKENPLHSSPFGSDSSLFESKVVGIQKVQGKKKPQETLKTEKQQRPTSNFQAIVQDLRRKCSPFDQYSQFWRERERSLFVLWNSKLQSWRREKWVYKEKERNRDLFYFWDSLYPICYNNNLINFVFFFFWISIFFHWIWAVYDVYVDCFEFVLSKNGIASSAMFPWLFYVNIIEICLEQRMLSH